jgi:hypothetical protein
MNKELIKKSLITNSVTFRENIKLPSLPSDKEGLNNIPIIDMPRSELIENNLVFELPNGFKKALELGFFLIKIPKEFNLSSADNFVRNFFKPKNGSKDLDKYRGFKDVDLKQQYQGYFDRDL